VEQSGELEDLSGALDADVPSPQHREHLRVGDLARAVIALGVLAVLTVIGEQDRQGPVGFGGDPGGPAAGLTQLASDAPGVVQPGAADLGRLPPALVEAAVVAGRA
jgi:hypothetical protein